MVRSLRIRTLRNRRLELNISEKTKFKKFGLKISAVDNNGNYHYTELTRLAKIIADPFQFFAYRTIP